MAFRILIAKLLYVALGSALLLTLLPMPKHASSMQAMLMDTTSSSQAYAAQGNVGGHSTASCCDAMGSFSLACDLIVSQANYTAPCGDGKRVVNSAPIVQSNYVEALTPPPKF